ncbi:pyridoxal-phosphate dependent enzyme [Vulcaniibacterium thermophilum]|uniref:Serine/threonine dehydratase n=1 Tax=Vulcaniibacterium thermophilum TaxID=1169913 RepID=A0A918Z028_9GAMM|nr:pyridoxal-phosphate dependent enzyme [Vulcaniibacterium thermophilum]GHE27970.1 serine/threonine dehydratase [Vulcaniibacterium thermophilum]
MSAALPSLTDVETAAARIAPHAHVTPVLRSRSLDRLAGCELHFKAENLQRIGAFKFRGACNAVFGLDAAAAARGVVTQSSGNHGAAIALACRLRGIPAHVVVPHDAPQAKLAAIRGFGARLVPCAPTLAARDAAMAQVQADTGAEAVHPYNDARVIAGQGTVALELLRQADGLDAVIAPVSGGGLLSGIAIAAHGLDPRIEVWGAEPAQAADAHASLARGERVTDMVPDTICDGLRAQLGTLTFPILRAHCAGIALAGEAEIVRAMRLIWERLKLVVEPSAAVPLAVVLRERERFAGRRVGIVLSGGNLDLDALPGLFALAGPPSQNA